MSLLAFVVATVQSVGLILEILAAASCAALLSMGAYGAAIHGGGAAPPDLRALANRLANVALLILAAAIPLAWLIELL